MSDENVDLPDTQSDEFSAELDCDRMEFKDLWEKQFACMVSTGDRNECKALTSTIHGPYSFFDMVSVVGKTWSEKQHHMKPFILNTKLDTKAAWLDQGTVDYIEAHWEKMILVGVLEKELFGDDDDDEVVINAGIVEVTDEDNILNRKNEEEL